MRYLLAGLLVLLGATPGQCQIKVLAPVPEDQEIQQPQTEFVPPADGGLGSTMTLKQQGAKVMQARQREKTKVLSVQAAAEPDPALKYRLWHPKYQLKPGSAQLHFSRAVILWQAFPQEERYRIDSWSGDEVKPTPRELEDAVNSLSNVYAELHMLATSEDTQWDHRLRDLRGPGLYMYLLEDVQQARGLARLLDRKIDYQLAQRDVEGAVQTMCDGMRLASFVGQGETLVQQLVGIAIQSMMLGRVEEIQQLDGGPNLYWALATIPRPLIDINESVQFELSAIHRILPILEEAEKEAHDEKYWVEGWSKVLDDLDALGAGDRSSKIAFAIISVAAAEPAKERLIASGMDSETVKAMPALRAVLIDASHEIRRVSDNLAKANFLPNVIGKKIADEANESFQQWIRENQYKSGAAAIVGLLFPAVQAAQSAGVRQEYVINRLMTIEAIRQHAASHDGKLPQSLDELSPVPALPNPFTGEAFKYEVDSNDASLATLTGEVPPGADYLKVIRVRIQK